MAKKPQPSQPQNPSVPPSESDNFDFGTSASTGESSGGLGDQSVRDAHLNVEGAPTMPANPFHPEVKTIAPFSETAPQSEPVSLRVPSVEVHSSALSESEKVDMALRSTEQPIASSIVEMARLGLTDLTIEQQLELAIAAHETIGKASGYLPDFNSMTENMKGAYLKLVRDIWLAAQRQARVFS